MKDDGGCRPGVLYTGGVCGERHGGHWRSVH